MEATPSCSSDPTLNVPDACWLAAPKLRLMASGAEAPAGNTLSSACGPDGAARLPAASNCSSIGLAVAFSLPTKAWTCQRSSASPALVEAVCGLLAEHDAVGSDLLRWCMAHGLAPADPAERASFLLLTGQAEQYRALGGRPGPVFEAIGRARERGQPSRARRASSVSASSSSQAATPSGPGTTTSASADCPSPGWASQVTSTSSGR